MLDVSLAVTRRRIIEPGRVWALDRRTTRRHFLFTPDEARQMEQLYWYTLAYAAQKYGVLVHAGCLMSTHPHEVVTDVQGVLPRFLQTFHRLLALGTKALRGWPEEVFNKHSTGAHVLLTPEAMVQSLAYLSANPVEALAVRYARDWPGAQTLPAHIGQRVIRVERPSLYFADDDAQWPQELELELTMPAALELEYGSELARARIAEQLRQRERAACNESKRRGIPFAGSRRVVRMPHTRRAKSYEPFGTLNPQFAAAGDPEAARQAVLRLRRFNADYDNALARWTAGDRRAVFPFGTWWMRVHHGARCRPPP